MTSSSSKDREPPRTRRTSASAAAHTEATASTGNKADRSEFVPQECNALRNIPRWLLSAAAILASGFLLWSYWPTLVGLVKAWETEPDYSHGVFVAPLAAYFLWARRESFPGVDHRHSLWFGVLLLLAALLLRFIAAAFYLEPLDGWSLLLWLGGICGILGGWRWIRWALPSIAFLFFMIPLPFRVERMLSQPLQAIAARLSGWGLQCFGLPAVTQGNTILLGDHTLEVEQACSGLTIFVGIAALAYAYCVLVRRSWWEKGLLILAVLPVALIANATRIILTGLLFEYASDAAAKKFSHDLAGWLMLPFAALLFALVLGYLGWLFPVARQIDTYDIVRSQSLQSRSR